MKSVRILLIGVAAAIAALAHGSPVKHDYDLKNVLWKLSFDFSDGTIKGDATNTLTLSEDTPTVELNCSDLLVSEVTVNGAAAKFNTGDDKLTVNIPGGGHAGETLAVRAIYAGAPANGLFFVPGSRAYPAKTPMVYTQGEAEDNHFWLPTYDLPDDKATTECFITVPASWLALSNGRLVDVQDQGSTKVFHWKMDQPVSTYLIAFTAGVYDEHTSHWRDIPVTYYVPPGFDAEGELAFGTTPKMIDLFSRLTGVDYPYAKYAQAVVGDFMYGGMENVSCTTQTIRTLHPASAEPVSDSTNLVAHELAHHWFGDLVTCRTWEHMWLNEGFATTMPLFYFRDTRGQDAFDMERYGNFESAIDTIGSRNRVDVNGDIGSLDRVTVGSPYAGGCARILMLMHMLGEDVFWKGIHAYLDTYKFKPATTDDFFNAMSKATGQNLSGFEKTWFYSPATPSLSVGFYYNKLQITQHFPYYTFDLPLWILDGDTWIKKTIPVSGQLTELELGNLATKPFLLDPEVWVPAEIKYEHHFDGMQVYQLYRHAPNAASKARIIAAFFSRIQLKDRIAIAHTETSPLLLAFLASHMGDDSENFLVELSHNADERVVNAAAQALGKMIATDDVSRQRLLQLLDGDKNDKVREQAMQALLNGSVDFRFVQMAWALPAFDDGFRIMAIKWWGDHIPDEARSRCLEILKNPGSEPLRVVAIQVLGKVGEKGDGHEVFHAIVPITQETSFNARAAAVTALGLLGNKDAIPVLQPISERAHERIEGLAKEAIKKLEAAG